MTGPDGNTEPHGFLLPFTEPLVEIGAGGRPTGVEKEQPGDELDRAGDPFEPDDIGIETQNVTIALLLDRLRKRTVDLAHDFRRRSGMWSDVRQSRLIESLLLRIPVASFWVAQQEDDTWSVVDGVQRLTAIARFVDPEAVGLPSLTLRGLDYLERLQGLGYDELSGRLRLRLRETQVAVHIVRYGTPEAVRFNVFCRVNAAGGPRLTGQEIRHAMIPGDREPDSAATPDGDREPGSARELLARLAESQEFGEATGWSVSNERMADREMALRFLAFRLRPPSGYREPDFDRFLTDAMHRANALTPDQKKAHRIAFNRAMDCARDLFGEHAFRKYRRGQAGRAPVNKALFETVAVNLAALDDDQRRRLVTSRDAVLDGFFDLMEDWDFERAISIATGDPKKVRARFDAVERLFRGVIDGD